MKYTVILRTPLEHSFGSSGKTHTLLHVQAISWQEAVIEARLSLAYELFPADVVHRVKPAELAWRMPVVAAFEGHHHNLTEATAGVADG